MPTHQRYSHNQDDEEEDSEVEKSERRDTSKDAEDEADHHLNDDAHENDSNNALDQFLGDSARCHDDAQSSSALPEGNATAGKEVIMGTTLRNLSGTFKEAKAAIAQGKIEELSALNDDYEDDFNMDSARHQPSAAVHIDNSESKPSPIAAVIATENEEDESAQKVIMASDPEDNQEEEEVEVAEVSQA